MAADAICCVRLGMHAAGDNHRGAVLLLRDVADVGMAAGDALASLLGIKQKAQYGMTDPSPGETTKALRQMEQIIDLARSVV